MIKIENEPEPEQTNKSSELYFLLAKTLVDYVKEDLKNNEGDDYENSIPVPQVVISKELIEQINKVACRWGWTINQVDKNSLEQAVMQNVPKVDSRAWSYEL